MSATTSAGNILIVDSDENIRELLAVNLASEGYSVFVAETPEEALKTVNGDEEIHLVIVDGMDADFSGIDFISEVKDSPLTQAVGVFMCTTGHSQSLIVEALDAGADDFISKPFSLRELLARVKSYLRRHHAYLRAPGLPKAGQSISFIDLSVDLRSRTATRNGMPLALSRTEYAILELLIRHIDTFLSRSEIHHSVWKEEAESPAANERIVDTNISRLRKKLGDTGAHLKNRTGLGYMLSTN